jgi:hypothetical protein
MREVVFRIQQSEPSGALQATADNQPLTITAPSLEELQHEAREALIAHFGPAHVAYRVRLRRPSRPRVLAH